MVPVDFFNVVRISNNLPNLIPVGVLAFYGLPLEDCALQGVAVDASKWKWFDADFVHYQYRSTLSAPLRSLVNSLRLRFLVATYRVFQVPLVPFLKPEPICIVRVYAVPLDIDGSRYFKQWRTTWPNSARTFQQDWSLLLEYLDFSTSAWNAVLVNVVNLPNLHISVLLPCFGLLSHFAYRCKLNGMSRLLEGRAFSRYRDELVDSLESVVQRIYASIAAPDLSHLEKTTVAKSEGIPSAEELISGLLSGLVPLPGVKTGPYPFQLRSMCKMYEKEIYTRREPVPSFATITSPTGSTYHFDSQSAGFYRSPELYTTPRGGILAENMGLGKTLICLALICLTKHEHSAIPDDLLLHHDQALDYSLRLGGPKSLSDISIDTINSNSLPWKYYLRELPSSVVDKLTSHPGSFRLSVDNGHGPYGLRSREKFVGTSAFRTLYLCSTTLLVVPENLFHQWNFELKKHINSGYLKCLFVSDRFNKPIVMGSLEYVDAIPLDPRQIIQYDLVLITAPVFSKIHLSHDDVHALMQVYWKRLIIDEGHTMNSKSSNLSTLCSNLQAERRWAVTGTPTNGLTTLHMDEEDQSNQVALLSPKKKRKYVVKSKFNVKDDLLKLGVLVGNYFKIEPFHTQPKLWNLTIIRSLNNENRLTAELSLQKLLNTLMVRHGLAQFEQDLNLPQLHHEAVFIQPSYHDKLAINLFTSVLAVNAVSSEREGSDYMFDSSNRQQLRRLVANLQLATFYWTGFPLLDVETLISVSKHCLSKKNADGHDKYSPKDRELLAKALRAAEEATLNPRWRTSAMLHEMQYYVSGLPVPFVRSFGTGSSKGQGVFGAPHLAAVQDFFYKNRFMDMTNNVELSLKLKEVSRRFWTSYWNYSSRKDTKFKKQELSLEFDIHAIQNEPEEMTFGDLSISPHRKSSLVSQDWRSTREDLTRSDGEGLKTTDEADLESQHDVENVKEAQILGTASAKLSYLSSRLVDHQSEGIKSIVFFENEDSAYYLSEILDVLGVNYILYATHITAGQRANNLTDFDSYDSAANGGITLIMDLRLAAHGLTIISATRVYFVSPVWQRSVEAQAIKRAHRIGQAQEVFVETLVLQGTLEEEIYKRRERKEPQEEERGTSQKYVIDDTGMQQFILTHDFLPTDVHETEFAHFSAPAVDGDTEPGTSNNGTTPNDAGGYSLLDHSSTIKVHHFQRHKDWKMRLFNLNNMQKLTNAKKVKADAEQLNAELITGKIDVNVMSDKIRVGSIKRVTF